MLAVTLTASVKASYLFESASSSGAVCAVAISYASNTGATGPSYGPCSSGGTTFTSNGSPNTLGFTSAFDLTTAAYTDGSAAQASASGDLASGTVHAYASTGPVGGDSVSSQAQIELMDQLTFTIPGANSSTLTSIGFSYTLDGSFLGSSVSDSVYSTLQLGGNGVEVAWSGTQSPYIAQMFSGAEEQWTSQSYGCFTTSCLNIQGTLNLQGADPVLNFMLSETLNCNGGDVCLENYSNTGVFTLTLPQGVTFTSSSGVFLTQSDTPEPSSIALVTLGLIGIVLANQRVGLGVRKA